MATAQEWTVAKVKEQLPSVPVRVGKGKATVGRVSGRLNKFATVSITNDFPRSNVPLFADFQVAWETLVHVLNTGEQLRL